MSVRTKLIGIFLGVSVLPLAALTFISYTNSIRSLKELVAGDNRAAAEDLQARLSVLNEEVRARLTAVSELPELADLDLSRPLENDEAAKVAQAMQREVKDRWSLFSEMEFVPDETHAPPAAPAAASPPTWRSAARPRPLPSMPEVPAPPAVPGVAPAPAVPATGEAGEKPRWSMKIILPDFAALDESQDGEALSVKEYRLDFEDGAPTEETLEALTGGVVDNLVRLPGFVLQTGQAGRGFKLRNLQEELRRELARSGALAPVEGEASGEVPALEAAPAARRAEILRSLESGAPAAAGDDFVLPVRRQDEVVGQVVGRIRSDRLLSQVFGGMPTSENEIAFAVDRRGNLYTRDAAHLGTLKDLGLAQEAEGPQQNGFHRVPANVTGAADLPHVLKDPEWVAVVEENPETGYSFGVVRRVRAELMSIRNTALLNLFLGFTLIGLAGSGIIVFSRRMTRRIENLAEGARRLAEGELTHRMDGGSKDELGELARAFNDMAEDLEASRQRLVEQERFLRELEIARGIQKDCLPRLGLRRGALEIDGRSIPSKEVGGDFFNFIETGPSRTAVLIGDVSGKGIPAALLMAEAQGMLRTILRHDQDVARVLIELNEQLNRARQENLYLTVFLAILDEGERSLTYVNAGHTPPLILRAGGTVEQLDASTQPLGLFEEQEVIACRTHLEHGDLLCLYTDGVVESASQVDSEEFYGVARLEQVLRRTRGRELGAVLDEVAKSISGFHGQGPLEDDATMVLVHLRSGPSETRRPALAEAEAAPAVH
jgi:serine phosphatase RsbU (regulator of sigma subunit)